MSSTILYVLSNPAVQGRYKVGIHSGSIKKLFGRYSTYIPNVKIHLVIKQIDARAIESKFKHHYSELRVPLENSGRLSEWFDMDLFRISTYLLTKLPGKNHGVIDDGQFTINRLGRIIVNGVTIITALPDKSTDL